jgi:hypothetical protein
MTQTIKEFQHEYRFLSNFWPASVQLQGLWFPTVEHAYQAAKTLDIREREAISYLSTPGEAKRAGRYLLIRTDWEEVRLTIMESLIRQKFRSPSLRQKLLETGNAKLEEGNRWGDRFWGIYNRQGENHLGKILMKIRDEIRAHL